LLVKAQTGVLLLLIALSAQGLFAQIPSTQGEGSREFIWPTTTVAVRIRSARGTQLQGFATVRLSSSTSTYDRTTSTGENGEAIFEKVSLGNYLIEATAPGFDLAREEALVTAVGDPLRIVVYLQPAMGPGSPSIPSPAPVLTPKQEREIGLALESMRRSDASGAKNRLEKLAKQVPGHPDPPYLLGLLYLQVKDVAGAKIQFQKAAMLYPGHARALSALGELSMSQGDYPGAIRMFGQALDRDASIWRTHALIATALLHESQFEAARIHAERALELSKGKSADPRLIAAQAFLGLRQQENARVHLEAFVREWPDDPRAGAVRKMLEQAQAAQAASELTAAPAVPASARVGTELPEPTSRKWAPPDVDELSQPIAGDVPCALPGVLEAASRRAEALVSTLERIAARETIEHSLLDQAGNVRTTETRDFNYLATIRKYPQRALAVSEEHDGQVPFNTFSSGIAASGLAAMALVFHPFYAPNYEMRCEGLGDWKGQPAWLVRFRQKSDRSSNFYTYRIGDAAYEIPLKGLAWIATNSGDVLRLELDAAEFPAALQLTRNHLAIEYGLVAAEGDQTRLWLPSRAELYSEYKGRRHRVRHTFSDFRLFSVRSEQKIQVPPAPPTP